MDSLNQRTRLREVAGFKKGTQTILKSNSEKVFSIHSFFLQKGTVTHTLPHHSVRDVGRAGTRQTVSIKPAE